MPSFAQIQLIAIVISLACAIPGCLLVIKQMSMLADSITHTVLLGIVIAYFVTKDLNSPFLIIGASLMGLVTVWLTETVERSKKVSADAAIGLIYPLLFSIAIILITQYGSNIHLDTDSVLLGELAFAPFDRWDFNGIDMGPRSLYTCGTILIINSTLTILFYKEIKLATFDQTLSKVLGFNPILIHYMIMSMVSLTTVAAFESVGGILVIALMIGPANIAYILTDKLGIMILLSAIVGALSSVIGVQIAFNYNISIGGSIATTIGCIFLILLIVKKIKYQ